MCYVEVCSISVDFTLILLSFSGSNDWINVRSERKIKLIEEEQFHDLGLRSCDMVGTFS